jgi:phage protein D
VTAHDFLQRMTQGTKTRGFDYTLTDSVVAAIVAAENQLVKMPDAATAAVTGAAAALASYQKRPTRLQYRKSDLDFLRAMAAEYGIDLWLDGRVLYFKIQAPGLPPPQVELRRGASLVEFTARLSTVGQVAGVRAQVYVESLRTQVGVEAGWDGSRLSVRVVPVYGQAGSGVYFDLPGVPVDQPVEAIRLAVAELRRRLNSRVTGRGTAVGDPRLRVGSVVALTGMGSFSGENYRLTSVTHVLDGSGYRTGFEVRQEVV